jgi:OPA family glycerol-3-phosphate transporter-like MFS transporter
MQNQAKPKSTKEKQSAMALIALCWLVYSCSYIGKINYAANIIRIQEYFAIENHSEVGLVTTLFFFSYGVGQVVNGIWCKKYNLKWIIFASLMISGTINLIIPLLPSFEPYKYLWVVNGFTLAILWPSLIRLLSETLPKKYMAKASVIMGTTVAVGTFFVYGTSAVYAGFTSFKAAFFTAAIVLISVATVWILFISKLMEAQQKEEEVVENTAHTNIQTATGKQTKKVIYFTICILSFCGIITNLIKDGLGTWVPSILKGNYGLNDSLSIILTLALPIVAIFGNAFAVAMHEKMGDFVYQCALMFAISGAFIMVVIASFSLDGWWLLLVCFTVVTLLVSSCNSLITSIFPLFMRGKLNSGLIAGVLNGFCYVGSTLSTYGLAVIADKSGWMAVFWTLFWCYVAVLVATMIYFIVRKFVLRAGAREPREEA